MSGQPDTAGAVPSPARQRRTDYLLLTRASAGLDTNGAFVFHDGQILRYKGENARWLMTFEGTR